MDGNSLSVRKEICVWVLFAAAHNSSCGSSGYSVLNHHQSDHGVLLGGQLVAFYPLQIQFKSCLCRK